MGVVIFEGNGHFWGWLKRPIVTSGAVAMLLFSNYFEDLLCIVVIGVYLVSCGGDIKFQLILCFPVAKILTQYVFLSVLLFVH